MSERSADFDFSDVFAGFRDIDRVLDRYGRDLFTTMKDAIREDMRGQQRDRRSVTGAGWPARAPATRERAQRASKPRRRKSASTSLLGKIATAWKSEIDDSGLRMTNQVPFAAAHHEGATVGHGAKLPARPHLEVDPRHIDDAIDMVEKLMSDAWEKRK